MSVPVFAGRHVGAVVDPQAAVTAVRLAFVEYARGHWAMPPKVYLSPTPRGDFRAMPSAGGGHALLKWVTSFPDNPLDGLPTVSGVVLLSNASTGELEAVVDAAAVTAARTGAAAVLAAETLARSDAREAAVVGCGVNGRATARTFAALGRDVVLYDRSSERAAEVASAIGPRSRVAASLEEALACDVVATVTPGHTAILRLGTLRPGQHASLMGADGPGKAEIEVDELLRARIVCDEWAQASHNGDLSRAVQAGKVCRDDVAELGTVLVGDEPGRRSDNEITIFDSTGLAVQDLAIAATVLERYRADRDDPAFVGVETISL